MKVNQQLQLMESSIQKRIFCIEKAYFSVIVKDYEHNVKEKENEKDNSNVKSKPRIILIIIRAGNYK